MAARYGWTVRESDLGRGGGEIFRAIQTGSGVHQPLQRVPRHSQVSSDQGVALNTHHIYSRSYKVDQDKLYIYYSLCLRNMLQDEIYLYFTFMLEVNANYKKNFQVKLLLGY